MPPCQMLLAIWGQRGMCSEMSRLRVSPFQSPGSALWLEGAKGLPALGRAEARPVTGHPFYLSMTTAANIKCILCARHVGPCGPHSDLVDVEAEAWQTCLRLHRLALPGPFMVGEMTWARACPKGIGMYSLHTPRSSHATDIRQHCVLANLHKPMRTPPYTLNQQ